MGIVRRTPRHPFRIDHRTQGGIERRLAGKVFGGGYLSCASLVGIAHRNHLDDYGFLVEALGKEPVGALVEVGNLHHDVVVLCLCGGIGGFRGPCGADVHADGAWKSVRRQGVVLEYMGRGGFLDAPLQSVLFV